MNDALNQCLNNLAYHRPQHQETQDRMEAIREAARNFAIVIYDNTMQCRETQMAYTSLEQATMNAIASLARNEEETLANIKERNNA